MKDLREPSQPHYVDADVGFLGVQRMVAGDVLEEVVNGAATEEEQVVPRGDYSLTHSLLQKSFSSVPTLSVTTDVNLGDGRADVITCQQDAGPQMAPEDRRVFRCEFSEEFQLLVNVWRIADEPDRKGQPSLSLRAEEMLVPG